MHHFKLEANEIDENSCFAYLLKKQKNLNSSLTPRMTIQQNQNALSGTNKQ